MAELKYMQFYYSYLDAIEPLSDAERGRLFTALLEYGKTGAGPELSGNERFIYPMMKAQIDRDNEAYKEKCKKNSDNRKQSLSDVNDRQQPSTNSTKEKEKEKEKENNDMSNDISPVGFRQRYTTEQIKIIDEFFNVLRHTRKSAKLADSVILKAYQDWENHEPQKVIYALHKYVHTPSLHDKKENYVLGIIRNATMSDIEQYKKWLVDGDNNIAQPHCVKKNKFVNYDQREWDFEDLKQMEEQLLDKEFRKADKLIFEGDTYDYKH